MPDSMPASERDSWRSRLWRFLAAWDASLNTDPIESLERRVSALEREVQGRAYVASQQEQSAHTA